MRNRLIVLASELLIAGAIATTGCGDGDDGDDGPDSREAASASGCTKTEGGTEVTGFCGAASLNTLTEAEELQLCNDTGDYAAGAISRAAGCKYVAIVAAASNSSPTEAELQSACSARESACNQDDTVMRPGENTQCSRIPTTCSATVEQYAACVMAASVVFEQSASALTSCSSLTFGNLTTVYEVPTAASDAPGCMAIKAACPNFSLPYIN